MIQVTKTFLPPLDEYTSLLKRAWDASWITNRGQLVLELEGKLKDFLKVRNIIIMNNGTIPIQIALKLMGDQGEIITTPFSYVATTSAILWECCSPVFVDIDPEYLTIDESKIEEAITPQTKAILATHVFGNPCAIEKIQDIADRYKLKVIFDAAHCFGVKYRGESIFSYGDISTCSFHATKLFHTGEGGAAFCNNEEVHHKLFYSHNFGHDGPVSFHGLGINGKISELQAAMGLALLPYMNDIISSRKRLVEQYSAHLSGLPLQFMKIREHADWNYSYFPVIFQSEKDLLEIQNDLKLIGVIPRRYFYPSLNNLPYVNKVKMNVSDRVSSSILCLPLFADLCESTVDQICEVIKRRF